MANIATYSGLWVDPLNILPNQVTIRDIAYPLSHICDTESSAATSADSTAWRDGHELSYSIAER